MKSTFDQLSETRSLARAKSLEDFEYFHSRVLPFVRPVDAKLLWEAVVRGERVEGPVTETFRWLFGELCKEAA